MNLLYKSTRNADKTVTASQAILKGLAEDGGLFVPTELPKLDVTMDELKTMSYQETAYVVMKQFLTDWYNWTEEGWCEIPALENASSAMQEDFYNGKLGAYVSSSNRATSISEKITANRKLLPHGNLSNSL